jgi:uncharacterized protein (DUF1778 family)
MSAATQARKEERLEARVSHETKALFQEAAALEGRSLTDFIVQSALENARRVIRETREAHVIRLNSEASRIFFEALLNPPRPNRKLREAARRYRKEFGGR